MLTVGIDTYITPIVADDIVRKFYMNSPVIQQWEGLSTEEKESCLISALYRIECLPFNSHKHNLKQPLQFPRGMSKDVPYMVKLAQVEEALTALDTVAKNRLALQEQGVTGVKLGNASESYDTGKKPHTGTLLSKTAYNYLRQYLAGTVGIV